MRRISDVSDNSHWNVLCEVKIESYAPMRVCILSSKPRVAESAGTKEPSCARIQISATWRTYELLPPMLGPVIRRARVELGEVEREVELGM